MTESKFWQTMYLIHTFCWSNTNYACLMSIKCVIHLYVFLQMIEITFFVLAILYGLTSVINRDWIETGLDNIFVTSMDMEVLYQFLAICSVALVPLIIINRFIGIIAVSKKWKHVLYVVSKYYMWQQHSWVKIYLLNGIVVKSYAISVKGRIIKRAVFCYKYWFWSLKSIYLKLVRLKSNRSMQWRQTTRAYTWGLQEVNE